MNGIDQRHIPDMRVTGQESLWPSNMPPCRSRASPGGSPISIPGAASMVLATPSASCGFSASTTSAPDPGLLLKLLFTSEPLSIQVHPDDAFARSIGLSNGKTEAWYILSATPDARVASGAEAAPHATGIARRDQGRLDRRSRSMAFRRERRHHLRPRRHHPRHRRRHRARRNSAAQRRDIPSVRLRPAARIARRQRRRRFRRGAGTSSSRFRGVSPRPERP